MVLLLAATTLLDMRSNGPPEHRPTTDGRFRELHRQPKRLPSSPLFTLHIHQDSPGLRDDQRSSRQVPDVHPDLIIRFNTARRHQAHVDGCSSCAAYAGDTNVQSQTMEHVGSDRRGASVTRAQGYTGCSSSLRRSCQPPRGLGWIQTPWR